MFGKALPVSKVRIGSSIVDFQSGEILLQDCRSRLEPKALEVLRLLAREPGAVVTRDSLLDGCWPDCTGSDEALTQAVAQIRRAFRDDSRSPSYVQTIPKRGYRLVASVEGASSPGPADAGAAAPPPSGDRDRASVLSGLPSAQRRPRLGVAAALVFVGVLSAAATSALLTARSHPSEKRILLLKKDSRGERLVTDSRELEAVEKEIERRAGSAGR